MDFAAILKIVGPTLVAFLRDFSSEVGSPAEPSPTTSVRVPSQAIKHLQAFLNATVNPTPPLVVDGWLGPKTEAAIDRGIAMLKAAGIG